MKTRHPPFRAHCFSFSSKRNVLINTHLYERAAAISTSPEHISVVVLRHHHETVTTNVALHLIGHPKSATENQPLRYGGFLSNAKPQHECGLGSIQNQHAAQSLMGSCLGNSAANPRKAMRSQISRRRPLKSESHHSCLFPVGSRKA
jgi:hypothetical protein